MANDSTLSVDEAQHAIDGLLPVLGVLAEAAATAIADSQIVGRAGAVALMLREAAIVADAIDVIARRARL